MKVFVSHAATNYKLAQLFVDLLKLGAGIPHTDIFCSSIAGNIPNGQYFVQVILQNLRDADHIVSILSPAYFESQFCIAEAGAAQLRQLTTPNIFYSLVVPPLEFADLHGVLYGVQSGKINNPNMLDELRDRLIAGMPHPPSTSTWSTKRDGFLAASQQLIYSEMLSLITVLDVYPAVSTAPAITYKSKIRVLFRNDTGHDFEVRAAGWKADVADVRIQPPLDWSFQAEGVRGWEQDHWQGEAKSVQVPNGRAFRVWIGLDQAHNERQLRQRHEARKLGTIVLTIRIAGTEVSFERRL